MAERLRPTGAPLPLGGVMLRTPGLDGVAELQVAGAAGLRAVAEPSSAFLGALDTAGFTEQLTVAIVGAQEVTAASGSRAVAGDDAITVEVPGPGDGFAQVLLYTAEDGSLTWHLPEKATSSTAAPTLRTGDRRTYRVPRAVVPTDDTPEELAPPASRGLVATVGRKLFQVFAVRLVQAASRRAAGGLAARWEAAHRPYGLRRFGPGGYDAPAGDLELCDADWADLASGPALLFVHGTFSRSHTAFGALPPALMQALHARYGGRVFAFDHPTLGPDPAATATWLGRELAGRGRLTVDVVAHSRGGLVAREICEHGAEHGLGGVDVRRLVMVATPNAGTALADVGYWKTWVDRMTNILQFVPDNPVTDTFDAVLTLLTHVAVGTVHGLDGLRAMDPAGPYLRHRPNAAAPACVSRYRAVAADYEPPSGSPLWRVTRDLGTDLVFGAADNDLVVPTDGVFTVPGGAGFTIAEPLLFDAPAGVEHTGYWDREPFGRSLLGWLAA